MKKFISGLILLITLAVAGPVSARTVTVHGYYKPSTGHYVSSYHRTSANYTKMDNWSTKGNYNPYTGKKGYVNPYKY